MTNAPAALDSRVDHLRGPSGAPVILVYGDFQCPYTRVAYRRIQRLERRGKPLRLVFRHFPLTHIHPHALGAALAVEAAAAQGLYWPMHDILFKRQAALEKDQLRSYAAAVGVDLSRFDAELSRPAHAARIDRDLRSGSNAGVQGTPTIFVDGQPYRGDLTEHPPIPANDLNANAP